MNKILSIFMVLMLVAVPLMAADWTGTVKQDTCRITDNGDFNCMVDFSDGKQVVTEEVAYFRPKTADEYYKGVANRASTVADRIAAKSVIETVVEPNVRAEYGKPLAITITKDANGSVTTSYEKAK